jgi:4-hydroxybenzoate polyprenyltransferase
MRLHQPTGTWLLFWPCAWGIALASDGLPNPVLLVAFALGALLMRSAGCIINDIWDRKIDAQVERTRTRPLASGEVSVPQALKLLAVLLAASFCIALLLGMQVIIWSIAALPLVLAYPLMKRITWWPQAFLGLTFNWGALLGTVAVVGNVTPASAWLYAAGICWTLGYDTIYAHQDREDDARVGVKSTARLLGTQTRVALAMFYALACAFLALAGYSGQVSIVYYPLLLPVALHFIWQVCYFDWDKPQRFGPLFACNRWVGGLVFLVLVTGRIIEPH